MLPQINVVSFKQLTPNQQKAAQIQNGVIQIVAGAGSGKTLTLGMRVAQLIKAGIDPKTIMMVTFTKKAANEMKERVNTASQGNAQGITVGTFHSIAYRHLYKYYRELGYSRQPQVINYGQSLKLIEQSFMEQATEDILDLIDNETIKISIFKNLLNKYSDIREHPVYAKTFSITESVSATWTQEDLGSNYSKSFNVDLITSILNKVEEIKRKENKIDYTDMLVNFLKLLKLPKNRLIFDQISQKVKHLIVDEYQDVNALQHEIAERLGKKADSFMIVGDDDQSIYGFRGAKMEFLIDFKNEHPDVKIISLDTNFRSSQEILNLANTSISNNTNRIEKRLSAHTTESKGKPHFYHCYNQHHQAYLITQEILQDQLLKISLKSHAVLVRQKFEVEMLIEMFIHCNINYSLFLGSETSSLRKDIHNLISFLRIGLNPYEKIPWLRVLPLHKGIDQIYTKQTVDNLFSNHRPPGEDPLEYFIKADFNKFAWSRRSTDRDASLSKMRLFLKNMYWDDEQKERKNVEHSSISNLLLKILDYNENYIGISYERDTLFDHFFKSAQNFRKQLVRFLEYWDPPKNNDNQLSSPIPNIEEDTVIITTIHQAKGLEWDKVYIMNFLKDFIPHKRAKTLKEIEEERRLFHVAVTRAKTHLTVYIPKYRNPWYYEQSKAYPSQFYEDIRKSGDFIEKTIIDNRDWSDTDAIISRLNILEDENPSHSSQPSVKQANQTQKAPNVLANLDNSERDAHACCIQCGKQIQFDQMGKKTQCLECGRSQDDGMIQGKFCHKCGISFSATTVDPFCDNCFLDLCQPNEKGMGYCVCCRKIVKFDPKLFRVRCRTCYFNHNEVLLYCHKCGRKKRIVIQLRIPTPKWMI
jgi:DNA helicase-2/ATP-dependent DNA helicase PcrA